MKLQNLYKKAAYHIGMHKVVNVKKLNQIKFQLIKFSFIVHLQIFREHGIFCRSKPCWKRSQFQREVCFLETLIRHVFNQKSTVNKELYKLIVILEHYFLQINKVRKYQENIFAHV
ncbi:unnamed protein product [Paramecium sonneborni]|uniref:Uncharacterized protein n=1 Tax=Paramecium sonneborni TaxID=65129 RepID=A0A8S1NSH9_9CILI|nr:unnamed protein product [Paramecium sonneborni]